MGNPFETMEAAIIIGAIIQIAALVIFFILVNNVAKIKKSLEAKQASAYIEAAEMEAYLGNKLEAINNYKRAKYRYEKKESAYLLGDDITERTIADINKAIAELQES